MQNVRVFRGRAFGLGLFCVLRTMRAAENVRVRVAAAWRSGYNPNICSGFGIHTRETSLAAWGDRQGEAFGLRVLQTIVRVSGLLPG